MNYLSICHCFSHRRKRQPQTGRVSQCNIDDLIDWKAPAPGIPAVVPEQAGC